MLPTCFHSIAQGHALCRTCCCRSSPRFFSLAFSFKPFMVASTKMAVMMLNMPKITQTIPGQPRLILKCVDSLRNISNTGSSSDTLCASQHLSNTQSYQLQNDNREDAAKTSACRSQTVNLWDPGLAKTHLPVAPVEY